MLVLCAASQVVVVLWWCGFGFGGGKGGRVAALGRIRCSKVDARRVASGAHGGMAIQLQRQRGWPRQLLLAAPGQWAQWAAQATMQ